MNIEKLENEIKELLKIAERNYNNGKYENEQEKQYCYFIYYGKTKAYYNILRFLKYEKMKGE